FEPQPGRIRATSVALPASCHVPARSSLSPNSKDGESVGDTRINHPRATAHAGVADLSFRVRPPGNPLVAPVQAGSAPCRCGSRTAGETKIPDYRAGRPAGRAPLISSRG